MTGYRDFIVQVEDKSDTMETDKGVLIHLDKRWNQKETANTVAKVISVPCGYAGPVKVGFNLFVDPTIFFEQTYEKGGKMQSPNLIDKKNNHYKVPPSMVICYSEGEGTMWKGFNDNLIAYRVSIEKEEEQELKKIGSIIIPNTSKKEVEKPKYRLLIVNELLEEVVSGDEVIVNEDMIIQVHLRGEKLLWLRNKDILAVVENKDVA